MMNGDSNFLLMFGLLVAGIVVGATIAQVLHLRLPKAEQNIGQALLLVALALRATFDEAEVKAVAGWIYDNTMIGQYYSRDDWITMVLRVFEMLPQETASAAQSATAAPVSVQTDIAKRETV